ncbi:MAG: hypothetical protein V9G23_10345 [Giesbergeria sp.]
MQSFRIEDAGQRTVYSFSERFEPHFKGALAQDGGRALAGLHALPDALVTAGRRSAGHHGRAGKALSASRAGAWPTGWRCSGPC